MFVDASVYHECMTRRLMNHDLIPITELNSVTVVSANYIRSPQGGPPPSEQYR